MESRRDVGSLRRPPAPLRGFRGWVASIPRAEARNGMPLARVLRLITGHDGDTLSDLRGLYAWLTTLAPEHTAVLASRDPVALIFYGDPESLPPAVKTPYRACKRTYEESCTIRIPLKVFRSLPLKP
jgi:hypothetical protein